MKTFRILLVALTALLTANSAFAQTWTLTSAPVNDCQSVASSADGTRLAAGAAGGPVFTSTDSGVTWTSNRVADAYFWNSIASSADGTKLVALAVSSSPGTTIYTSTNAGVDWVSNSIPNHNLIAVASSADGSKLVAVVGATVTTTPGSVTNGPIFTSTNSGVTWQQSGAPIEYWSCIASSADGNTLAAGTLGLNTQGLLTLGGCLYVSTNAGATWLQTSAPTNDWWASIACSADGSKLIAAARSIYTSTNSGVTWTSNNVPPSPWTSVASSADGSKLVAVSETIPIYISTNSGATWMSNNVPNNVWTSVASSADGAKLVAAAGFDLANPGIYTSYSTPSPVLNITAPTGNVGLSWIVPSTNFVLQQNLDLTTTNWADVTNPPVLNLTNLQNEIILSPTNSSGFYRLKTQ
jgi:hypothetical protein